MQRGPLLRRYLWVAMPRHPARDRGLRGRGTDSVRAVDAKKSDEPVLSLSGHWTALFHREAGRREGEQNCDVQDKSGGTAARKNPVCTLGWDGTPFFLLVPRCAHGVDPSTKLACRLRWVTLDYASRALKGLPLMTCASVSLSRSQTTQENPVGEHRTARARRKALQRYSPKVRQNYRLSSGAILSTLGVARSILELLQVIRPSLHHAAPLR